jgi:hypothetical protein
MPSFGSLKASVSMMANLPSAMAAAPAPTQGGGGLGGGRQRGEGGEGGGEEGFTNRFHDFSCTAP